MTGTNKDIQKLFTELVEKHSKLAKKCINGKVTSERMIEMKDVVSKFLKKSHTAQKIYAKDNRVNGKR